MKNNVWMLLIPIFVAPAAGWAQVCRGGVGFADTKVQGQVLMEFESSNTLYGASGGFGGSRYYGIGTIGLRTYSDRDGATVILAMGGGRTFRLSQTGNANHCLELHGEFGTGPDNQGPQRSDQSNSSLSLNLYSSLPIATGAAFQLVPFAGLSAAYSSIVTQFRDNTSHAANDFYELVTLGIGVRGKDLALHPYVQLPLGRDSSDPRLGLRASLKIGRK